MTQVAETEEKEKTREEIIQELDQDRKCIFFIMQGLGHLSIEAGKKAIAREDQADLNEATTFMKGTHVILDCLVRMRKNIELIK